MILKHLVEDVRELKEFKTEKKRVRVIGGFFVNLFGRVLAGVLAGVTTSMILTKGPIQVQITPSEAAAVTGAVN